MWAILRIMAIFVLAVTTAADLSFQRYSDKAYKALGLINAGEKVTAELVNYLDVDVHLKLREPRRNDAVTFELDPKKKTNSEVALGIKINEGEQVIFDISAFSIRLFDISNVESSIIQIPCFGTAKEPITKSISIVFLLKPRDADRIMLEIPVFLVPEDKYSDYEYTKPFVWADWAKKNKVGKLTPKIQEALKSSYFANGKLSLDFLWLAELLSYDIYPNKKRSQVNGKEVVSYATRPLVVSEYTRSVLSNIFKSFQA